MPVILVSPGLGLLDLGDFILHSWDICPVHYIYNKKLQGIDEKHDQIYYRYNIY